MIASVNGMGILIVLIARRTLGKNFEDAQIAGLQGGFS